MENSTDVEVKDPTEIALAQQEELERELAEANRKETDQADIQIPLLKVGHGQTEEVQSGDAVSGEFINALTREGLGTTIDFVVAKYQKGRFDHGVRGEKRARKAYGLKTVPWKDDPFFGRPFTEHPDAEEKYAQRVNAGELDWGKGPRISTTYDFTGHVVSGLEEDEQPIPVCLSLMRKNTKQAKKWITILDAVLYGRYWDAVFTLSTEHQKSDGNNYYTVLVKQGRKTTAEEKQRAVTLAMALRNQTVEVVGDDDTEAAATAEPERHGGMEV